MVDSTAHSGDIEKNPFNFKHYDCSEASIVVNGIHEPAEGFKIDINAGNYIDLYTDFLLNTGVDNEDRDFGIKLEDYIGGNFFIVFDRSKDKCNRYHRHPHDSGSIDINIRTKSNITDTVTELLEMLSSYLVLYVTLPQLIKKQ